MKKLYFMISLGALLMLSGAFGQNSVSLTFTGVNDLTYCQTDSIRVKNLSQDCDTVLYYPDTVLILNYLGILEKPVYQSAFSVLPNFPNPVKEKTVISLYIPERDIVNCMVTDVLGRKVIESERMLESGYRSFQFTPAGGKFYLFSASWRGTSRSIKILSIDQSYGGECKLDYLGGYDNDPALKAFSDVNEFVFSPGDQLLMIGYGNGLESGFADTPETSQDYVFQFATNIPCPDLDSLLYDGQWYHTIQVFSQCWMKENLNAGTMIPSSQAQANNSIVERYCLGDNEYYCNLVGGLYFWNEMMNYNAQSGGRGICPDGWHIPADLDWQILEGAVDSAYRIGDPTWGGNGWRGSDAGGNLKQTGTVLWMYPNTGATDAFGFTALPAGYFVQGDFWGFDYKNYLWSSQPGQKYYRNLDWNQAMIQRNTGGYETAFSVRCIRN